VRGDAAIADAQDGMHAREPVESSAARAGDALIALHDGEVAKVGAARSLREVAADRRHVAKLRGRAREQCLRQDGQRRADGGVLGEVAVLHERADADLRGRDVDRTPRQPADIDERSGRLDA
jgi:selenophosphate synthetase-related protein